MGECKARWGEHRHVPAVLPSTLLLRGWGAFSLGRPGETLLTARRARKNSFVTLDLGRFSLPAAVQNKLLNSRLSFFFHTCVNPPSLTRIHSQSTVIAACRSRVIVL